MARLNLVTNSKLKYKQFGFDHKVNTQNDHMVVLVIYLYIYIHIYGMVWGAAQVLETEELLCYLYRIESKSLSRVTWMGYMKVLLFVLSLNIKILNSASVEQQV